MHLDQIWHVCWGGCDLIFSFFVKASLCVSSNMLDQVCSNKLHFHTSSLLCDLGLSLLFLLFLCVDFDTAVFCLRFLLPNFQEFSGCKTLSSTWIVQNWEDEYLNDTLFSWCFLNSCVMCKLYVCVCVCVLFHISVCRYRIFKKKF